MENNPDESGGMTARLRAFHPSTYNMGPDMEQPYAEFDEDWWRDPNQRYKAMLRAAYWTVMPNSKNNPTRKIVTSILMVTWSTITVGIAFGLAEPGDYYTYMTIIVFSIVGSIWGFELWMLDTVVKNREQAKKNKGGER